MNIAYQILRQVSLKISPGQQLAYSCYRVLQGDLILSYYSIRYINANLSEEVNIYITTCVESSTSPLLFPLIEISAFISTVILPYHSFFTSFGGFIQPNNSLHLKVNATCTRRIVYCINPRYGPSFREHSFNIYHKLL